MSKAKQFVNHVQAAINSNHKVAPADEAVQHNGGYRSHLCRLSTIPPLPPIKGWSPSATGKRQRPLTIADYERDYREASSDLELIDRVYYGGMADNQLRSALWPYLFGLVKRRGRFKVASGSSAQNGHQVSGLTNGNGRVNGTSNGKLSNGTPNGHTNGKIDANGNSNAKVNGNADIDSDTDTSSSSSEEDDDDRQRTGSGKKWVYVEHEDNVKRWRELEKLYYNYQSQWESIMPDQELRFSTFRERKSLIERDVIRSDRSHPFYADNSQNLNTFTKLLMSYMMYDFDIGYLQGMSDLAAPILYMFSGDLVKSFWVFVEVMKLFRRNFEYSQKTIHFQLNCLLRLIKITDPKFAHYLHENECSNCFFAFRCIVCQFKRELMRGQHGEDDDYSKVLSLWDTIWSVQRRHELMAKSKIVHTFTIANGRRQTHGSHRHHRHHNHTTGGKHLTSSANITNTNHLANHNQQNHSIKSTESNGYSTSPTLATKGTGGLNKSTTTTTQTTYHNHNPGAGYRKERKGSATSATTNTYMQLNGRTKRHSLCKVSNLTNGYGNFNGTRATGGGGGGGGGNGRASPGAQSLATNLNGYSTANGYNTNNNNNSNHINNNNNNNYVMTTSGTKFQFHQNNNYHNSNNSPQSPLSLSPMSLSSNDYYYQQQQESIKQEQVVYTKETFYSSFDPNQADVPRFELSETEKFVLSLCLSLIRRERNQIMLDQLDASEIHQHFIDPDLASDLDDFIESAYHIYHYINTDCDMQLLVKGANELVTDLCSEAAAGGVGVGATGPNASNATTTTTAKTNGIGVVGGHNPEGCSPRNDTADTYDLLKDYLIISPTSPSSRFQYSIS